MSPWEEFVGLACIKYSALALGHSDLETNAEEEWFRILILLWTSHHLLSRTSDLWPHYANEKCHLRVDRHSRTINGTIPHQGHIEERPLDSRTAQAHLVTGSLCCTGRAWPLPWRSLSDGLARAQLIVWLSLPQMLPLWRPLLDPWPHHHHGSLTQCPTACSDLPLNGLLVFRS